jgi:hypothetical protein
MRGIRNILKPLIFILSFAQMPNICAQHFVEIGGIVDSDLTIRKLGDDSAYLVVSTLVVINGSTLTIEPGVKAFFSQFASLNVHSANLILAGTESDSISFYCEDLSRDWPGIYLRDVVAPNSAFISYVNINGASTAIYVDSSKNLVVSNCSFYNAFGKNGIVFVDCDNCSIEHSVFKCLAGVTLTSKSHNSVGNHIGHNVFYEGQTNITVSNQLSKICYDNVIEDNCFMDAPTAIYFSNPEEFEGSNKNNYVRNNVISSQVPSGNPGYVSYGLKTSMDSLVIEDNIFCNNDVAIGLMNISSIDIGRNSFYKNGLSIDGSTDSVALLFHENTISEDWEKIHDLTSAKSRYWLNNFLHHDDAAILFANKTSSAIDMKKNYWAEDDNAAIEDLIFDNADDPSLGPILYDEYLLACNTENPISPPFRVKKQTVGNDLLISWESNPEEDFSHYVLFYGDYKYYRFGQHVDSIFSNSYLLKNHSVEEKIAVVACDTVCDFEAYSVASKSAFAFAEKAVYAGNDGEMCQSDLSFALQGASVPFAGAELLWKTSGTGTFSDNTILRTVYYPSEEDFRSGMVFLTLVATSEGESDEDTMELQFREKEVVFAGEDSYSGTERPLQLSDAFAENFDSFYWSTLGDGHFNDSLMMNPTYFPGVLDVRDRKVRLVLCAHSICGESYDTVSYDLYDEFSMEGKVWIEQETVAGAQVLAISVDEQNNSSHGFFRTRTSTDGSFRFERIIAGNYMLYAFADTIDAFAGGAYYLQRDTWTEALQINVDGNVYDVDVSLPTIGSIGAKGPAGIRGRFDLPEENFEVSDFYCASWFADDSTSHFCDGGLSNIAISLMNESKTMLVGFALTNTEGVFRFDSLLYGRYCLMSEVPRYGQKAEKIIVLSPDDQYVDDILLSIDRQGMVSFGNENNALPVDAAFYVYPNPVTDKLFVSGFSGNASLFVLNSCGQKVMAVDDIIIGSNGEFSIDVKDLQTGLYLLQIRTNDSAGLLKFLKR